MTYAFVPPYLVHRSRVDEQGQGQEKEKEPEDQTEKITEILNTTNNQSPHPHDRMCSSPSVSVHNVLAEINS